MASVLNYFDDYDACIVCHQLQENGLSHLACQELGLIVQNIHKADQIDLSWLITNQEYDDLINPFGNYFIYDGFH